MLPHKLTAALFAALLCTPSCSSIRTERTGSSSGERTSRAPDKTQAETYVSPFRANGELTPWAAQVLSAGPVSMLPGAAVSLAGGWEEIERAGSRRYGSVEELTLHLVQEHRSHPEFERAVRLSAALYPDFALSIGSSIDDAASTIAASAKRDARGAVDSTINDMSQRASKSINGALDGVFGRPARH